MSSLNLYIFDGIFQIQKNSSNHYVLLFYSVTLQFDGIFAQKIREFTMAKKIW